MYTKKINNSLLIFTGHHTTYSLWSAQNSLKREHKRKFNRSLCGVLLGISIVLVILGILGIIGIAVYLGGIFLIIFIFFKKVNKSQRAFIFAGVICTLRSDLKGTP